MRLQIEKRTLEIANTLIQVEVIRERRRGVRFSVVKDGVNVRLPMMLTPDQEKEQFDRLEAWLLGIHQKKDNFFEKFETKTYEDGDTLLINARRYTISILLEEKKSHSGKLKNGIITLSLSKNDSAENRSKAIQHLLSRLIADDFLPAITARIMELNQQFFQKNIKSVRLKYNHSNWGSCSRDGNINLSTRLLFAPPSVIDYVIVHELSHLVEMNHSARFWKVVADVMPDYQEKEKWLAEFGPSCYF